MKEYHTLVAIHMEESQLKEIAAVNPHLRVHNIAYEFSALAGRAPFGLRPPDGAALLDKTTAESRLTPLLQEAEILYTAWVPPNLLQRSFTVQGPGQVYVSDLTCIRTGTGWLYLTIVLDLYSSLVVGWA